MLYTQQAYNETRRNLNVSFYLHNLHYITLSLQDNTSNDDNVLNTKHTRLTTQYSRLVYFEIVSKSKCFIIIIIIYHFITDTRE